MSKIKAIKAIQIILFAFLLTSCVHYIENPYNGVPRSQLRNISSTQLCAVVNNSAYKISPNVIKEVIGRGYKDCSESEVYCHDKLSLTPGSANFANCRLARDQYNLNVQSQQIATFLAIQQLQVQREAIYTPVTVNVNHSGYINHYIY